MVENPFLRIVPSEEEMVELEGLNVEEIANAIKEKGNIVLIVGEHGTGKSHLIRELSKRVGGEIIPFDLNLLDKIRKIKRGPIYIEDFDLVNGLSKETQKKIVSLIKDKSKLGITFVIEITPKILKQIKIKGIVFEMPKFTLEAAKKLVIKRLNEVRIRKSDDFSPFTEEEIVKAWKKSGHNPRMFLMLLSTLYDIKVKK